MRKELELKIQESITTAINKSTAESKRIIQDYFDDMKIRIEFASSCYPKYKIGDKVDGWLVTARQIGYDDFRDSRTINWTYETVSIATGKKSSFKQHTNEDEPIRRVDEEAEMLSEIPKPVAQMMKRFAHKQYIDGRRGGSNTPYLECLRALIWEYNIDSKSLYGI